MSEIDISEIDKAALFAALFNRARPQGLGFLHFKARDMGYQEAKETLEHQKRFDYCEGRVMKVDLSGNMLRTAMYNRDNGTDAAEDVVKFLREVERESN